MRMICMNKGDFYLPSTFKIHEPLDNHEHKIPDTTIYIVLLISNYQKYIIIMSISLIIEFVYFKFAFNYFSVLLFKSKRNQKQYIKYALNNYY